MDNKNLSSEALLSNNGDMTFLDIVLPIHNFTYIQAYRAKSVKLRQLYRFAIQILIPIVSKTCLA